MDEPPISDCPLTWQDLDLGSPTVAVRCLGLGLLSLVACCLLFQVLGTITFDPIAIDAVTSGQQR
ncbi:hypothetical protein [Synechococcus elongatus]|uniref:hypothetical protein n=1 Tax=Synechococcus elongatus TaxID=32046 RepID=UPI000F7E52E7|nr:hypothetical protein [Synechococcus elongatus]